MTLSLPPQRSCEEDILLVTETLSERQIVQEKVDSGLLVQADAL